MHAGVYARETRHVYDASYACDALNFICATLYIRYPVYTLHSTGMRCSAHMHFLYAGARGPANRQVSAAAGRCAQTWVMGVRGAYGMAGMRSASPDSGAGEVGDDRLACRAPPTRKLT